MDRIYARLATMREPAPPHKLPPIDNIRKIALTIELMRPLAVRQSLYQLFNVFVASRNLVLDEGVEGVAEKESNKAMMGLARSVLNAACTHPTQTPSVRNLSDSLKFLVTHLDLLLRREPHYETIEATLWSLDSTTAPREMSEGYFIPELDEEIEEVAVSPVFVKGFCALFDPSVPFHTRKAASLMFPLLTQSWFGRWMETVSGTRTISWEQRKVPVMGEQEMIPPHVSQDHHRPRQTKNRVTSETLLLQLSASESNHDQSDVSRHEAESEAESRQALVKPGRKSELFW